MRRLAAVLVLPLLVLPLLAACSTGDDTDSGDPAAPYVNALAEVFTSGASGPELDDETADCIATAIVELAGVPALTAADVTPEELADSGDLKELGLQLPTDASATLAAGFAACDLGETVIEPFIRALAEDSDGDLSDDAVDCVVDATSKEDVEAGLAATFVQADDGAAAFDAMVVGMGACPDAVTELLVNGFETANGEAVDLTDEARDCLAGEVEGAPEAAAGSFATSPSPDAEEFGARLGEDCPGLRT